MQGNFKGDDVGVTRQGVTDFNYKVTSWIPFKFGILYVLCFGGHPQSHGPWPLFVLSYP